MKCKLVVLSDKVLTGDLKIDFTTLSKLMLGYGIETEEILIKGQNEKFDDFSSPTFLLLHDESIDDFVSKRKIFYESKSEIIDNEGVLSGEEHPILILPIEGNLNKLMKSSLEIIKNRFNLPNILSFRMYGITQEQVLEKIKEFDIDEDYFVVGNNLITDLYVSQKQDIKFISEIELKINEAFGDYIYAQSSMEIEEVVAKMINLSNIKIAISDSFAYGGVAKKLLEKGVAKISSATYNYNIENGFIKTEDGNMYRDENEMVNKISRSLLEVSKSDIAITISGRKVGNYYQIFLSIGSKKSIDVYNLSIEGNLEDAIEVTIYSTLFNLIKKLRIKDFENL